MCCSKGTHGPRRAPRSYERTGARIAVRKGPCVTGPCFWACAVPRTSLIFRFRRYNYKRNRALAAILTPSKRRDKRQTVPDALELMQNIAVIALLCGSLMACAAAQSEQLAARAPRVPAQGHCTCVQVLGLFAGSHQAQWSRACRARGETRAECWLSRQGSGETALARPSPACAPQRPQSLGSG